MTRPATVERRPPLPPNLPPKLQTLLHIHCLVTSRRWQLRRASRDGTVHHLPDGPVMRVRTEDLTPVPPLERTRTCP